MSILSTAEQRRPIVIASALQEFARGGYHGTTIATVATAARISPAYVFKLFPSKERLFVDALDDCFDRILVSLGDGADAAPSTDPDAILHSMGGAYAQLIGDRTLILMQVHAQSVADVPEVRRALRAGLQRITMFAKSRSGASDDAVQHFMAYGQLCHLIVTIGLADPTETPETPDAMDAAADDSGTWASILAHGIRHP